MKQIILSGTVLLFTLLFFVVEDTEVNAQEVLQKGSSGQTVHEVQSKLSQMGYLNVSPTGHFGPLTERAVKDFQLETHLQVDGIVGSGVRNQPDNVEMMARVVHGEARGESHEGKVGVASVILNRKQSSNFPNTTHHVIFQTNAFTAVHDGQYNRTPDGTSYQAVIDALNGRDPTNGATYYYNSNTATNQWIFTRQAVIDIGKHTFAS